MTNKDNLSSLFNRNFLKYVPNSIYKYLQKRKFNIMIKLEISFSVRTSLSCLRFFSIVIAAYIIIIIILGFPNKEKVSP